MDDLIKCLEESCPYVDFDTTKGLLSDKVLESVDFVSMVAGIEDKYDIVIEMEDMTADNFDSIDRIFNYLQKRI